MLLGDQALLEQDLPSCFGLRCVVIMPSYALRSQGRLTIGTLIGVL